MKGWGGKSVFAPEESPCCVALLRRVWGHRSHIPSRPSRGDRRGLQYMWRGGGLAKERGGGGKRGEVEEEAAGQAGAGQGGEGVGGRWAGGERKGLGGGGGEGRGRGKGKEGRRGKLKGKGGKERGGKGKGRGVELKEGQAMAGQGMRGERRGGKLQCCLTCHLPELVRAEGAMPRLPRPVVGLVDLREDHRTSRHVHPHREGLSGKDQLDQLLLEAELDVLAQHGEHARVVVCDAL